ncbi:unnamed protein product [Coregonus sp. 'balchen']|nr:unnamed protein product [Coregonus sp. 'balchen']
MGSGAALRQGPPCRDQRSTQLVMRYWFFSFIWPPSSHHNLVALGDDPGTHESQNISIAWGRDVVVRGHQGEAHLPQELSQVSTPPVLHPVSQSVLPDPAQHHVQDARDTLFWDTFQGQSSTWTLRPTEREVPGITIFHSSATMYFANAGLYLEALKDKQDDNLQEKTRPSRDTERRELRGELGGRPGDRTGVFSVEEEAGQWREPGGRDEDRDREESLGDNQPGWCGCENVTVFVMPTMPHTPNDHYATLVTESELQDGDTTTLGFSNEDTLSRELDKVSLGSLGKWTWDIHSIILDPSTANFIDTVAIKTMRHLELGGFFSESITKGRLFATVH